MTRWRGSVLLTAIGLLVFYNGLSAPFMYDDAASITANRSIRDIGRITDVLNPPVETPVAGRPLSNLSFAINYAAAGNDPAGFRVVNLLLHIACGLLLLQLVYRWTGRAGIAFATALLWTTHPLTTEVVDYITQRTESLMALAMLLTLFWATRGRGRRDRPREAAAIIACAAGMGCKETMVVTPVLVIMADAVFSYDSLAAALAARWKFYAGLAATWLPLAYFTLSHGQSVSAGFASVHTTPWMYFLHQPSMILRYLWLTVWPVSLVSYYGWTQPIAVSQALVPLAVVSLAAITSVWIFTRHRAVGFLLIAFFLLLAPSSSFAPVATEVGAERRMYLPLMALVTLGVLAADYLAARFVHNRAARNRILAASLAAVAASYSIRTVYRNAEYRSPLVMSATILERWPSGNAHLLYGTALSAAGRHDEALDHYRRAISQGVLTARYFLGADLIDLGRIDEGVPELQQFLRDEPHIETAADAHGMLADVFSNRKQFSEAIEHYRALVDARPEDGRAWTSLAVALFSAHREREALTAFENAVKADPLSGEFRANLERARQVIR